MNEIPIETVVRENVRTLRKMHGWSQELLAERTGVSAPYITQIESGKRTPSLDIVERLAAALGVEYKSLFEPQGATKTAGAGISRHLLESRLISAVTDTIRREFMA